jgi:hypothetical protein
MLDGSSIDQTLFLSPDPRRMMPMETLSATPVRLGCVHAGHGQSRNHVLVEFHRPGKVGRIALTEPDARLLMEELGAALHYFRSQAAQTN